MDGKVSEVREAGLDELRAAPDEADKFFSENGMLSLNGG